MRIAGFGFRKAADIAALRDALVAAGGAGGISAIATIADKAEAPPLQALARELGVPLIALPLDRVEGLATPSHSARVEAQFGVGSVAEAAALVAAGDGARLIAPRAVSANGMAVAAIAEGFPK